MCLDFVNKPSYPFGTLTYTEIIIYFCSNIRYRHNLLSKYIEFVSNAHKKE